MTPVLSKFELLINPRTNPNPIQQEHKKTIIIGNDVNAMISFRDLLKCGIVNANPNKNPGNRKITAGCENESIKNVGIPANRMSPKVKNLVFKFLFILVNVLVPFFKFFY